MRKISFCWLSKVRGILALAAVCLLTLTGVPCAAGQTAPEGKAVRVAFVTYPGYQEDLDGDHKVGYGYEYLQKLASVTGWKYEYVYGPFGELLRQLEAGELDLMGNLSKTPEREKRILFGAVEQGIEPYFLYINPKFHAFNVADLSTLNGKRIGINAGTVQADIWRQWCAERYISWEPVVFSQAADRQAALNSGAIDAAIGTPVMRRGGLNADWEAVLNFGSSAFYFGVSRERPDLLTELNRAQAKILAEDPLFNDRLYNRYMKIPSVGNIDFSLEERARLQENGGRIRIGYMAGFLPLSGRDAKGRFTGVAADLFRFLEKRYADLGLRFEPVPYTLYSEMKLALHQGQIDAAWPVFTDAFTPGAETPLLTESILNTAMLLVCDGPCRPGVQLRNLGVMRPGAVLTAYVRTHFPLAEVQYFDSTDDAVSALKSGRTEALLYVATRYNVDVKSSEALRALSVKAMPRPVGVSFAVPAHDKTLAGALSKGLRSFGEAGAELSVLENARVPQEVTLREYLRNHPLQGNLVAMALIFTLCGGAIFVVYREMALQVRASRAEKEIYLRLANSDVLTGLLNRRAYEARVHEIALHPEKYPEAVLACFDINGARRANEAGGKPMGDRLIMKAAQVLGDRFGDNAFRVAGDNFAVIDPDGRYRQTLAQRVELVLEGEAQAPFVLAQGLCPLRREDGCFRTEAQWRCDADMALYKDKLADRAAGDYTEDEKLKAFIRGVIAFVDAKDGYTAHHSERVKELSVFIGQKLGLSDASLAALSETAELHDIGKIGVNDALLQKPARLTDEEFAAMKRHAVIGSDILERTAGMLEEANIIRHHHERYDGRGYPDGIAGEDIPLEARIIAVADSIDAMTSSRCYRKALPDAVVREEIRRNLGAMYDPAVGQIVLDHWDEILKIVHSSTGTAAAEQAAA